MSIADKLRLIANNVQKVFDSGKKAENKEFWDNALYSSSGTYKFAGSCWTDETFRPPKDITLYGNCNGCFYSSFITNFIKILDDLNITLTFNNPTSASTMFAYAKVTHFPAIDLSTCSSCNGLFNSCTELTYVDSLKLPKLASITQAFQNCKALTDITINGEIVSNGLNFQWSTLLTTKSLSSILKALSKDSSLAIGKSITFATAHQATIESDVECIEYATAAKNAGWTISYN